MAGAQAGTTEIAAATIDRAARVLDLRDATGARRRRLAMVVVLLAVVVAVLVIGAVWGLAF
jgi:hypothetical protein